MKTGIVFLLPLFLLSIALIPLTAEKGVRVAIISNKADMHTANFIGEILRNSSVEYVIMGPDSFDEALKGYEVILILGGPKAYDGVGNISSTYIPPQNATVLIKEPKTFLISVFKGGRDIVVLGGHTRMETLEASAFFFKDRRLLGLTKLWMRAGYKTGLSNGSYAIYYVEGYEYNKEKGSYISYPWGTDEWRVLGVTEKNGTAIYNVTRVRYHSYLGVNYTTVEIYLEDNLGRPHYCRVVQFLDGKVNSTMEGCRNTGQPDPSNPTVFIAFKMESVGNRTSWSIYGRNIPRTILHPVGQRRIRGSLILRYVLKYPDWKAAAQGFELEYVNPAVPFGGILVSVDNVIVDGEPITRELEKLSAFRP